MFLESRKSQRLNNWGKVESEKLCSLAGTLDDISTDGFGAHFPIMLNCEMDADYEFTVKLSSETGLSGKSFKLIAVPQWKIDCESGSKIGFSLLRSPDSIQYTEYVNNLLAKEQEINEY